jgi:hypothetical protein
VRTVWPRADRSKCTIEVSVVLDERPAHLRPDMAARVVFLGPADAAPAEAPGVAVPTRAVATRDGATVVFVVTAGVARATPVRTDGTRGDQTVVREGLRGGERVVLDPPPGLSDGARVP